MLPGGNDVREHSRQQHRGLRRRRRRSGAINLQLTLLYFRLADKFLFAIGMVLLVHFPSKNINLQNIMWRKNKEILFSQSIYM